MKKFVLVLVLINFTECDSAQSVSCPKNCLNNQACQNSECSYGGCVPGWWGRKCEYPLECEIRGHKEAYRGTKDVTRNNHHCVDWTLHSDVHPPDGVNAKNYCRKVDSDNMLWCYYTISRNWDICDIPFCDTQCPPPNLQPHSMVTDIPPNGFAVGVNITVKYEVGYQMQSCCKPLECLIPGDNGVHYRGTQSTADGGRICAKWNARRDYIKPEDGSNHNYCRHVTIDPQPNIWCYTVTGRWAPCTIPTCDSKTLLDVGQCQKGYYHPRTITIRCQENMLWSQNPQTCVNINECENNPCQANASCADTEGSYQCRCDEGYQDDLHGHCNDINECSTNPCGDHATCSNVPGSFTCNCITGYQNDHTGHCSEIICAIPTLKHHSRALISSTPIEYLDNITIVCEEGYTMLGNGILQCQANKMWNYETPACEAICNKPAVSKHSKILHETNLYRYQDNITILCEKGYETTDKTQLTCKDDKTWNGKPPVCQAVTCEIPLLKNHSSAITKSSQIEYLGTITIECDEGYYVEGTGVLQCQANKMWDQEAPSCTAKSFTKNIKGSSANLTAIIGGTVAVLVVIVIIIAVIIFQRRQRYLRKDDSRSSESRKSDIKADRLPHRNDFEMSNSRQRIYENSMEDDEKYYEINPIPSSTNTSVRVDDFDEYVSRRLADKELLVAEYKKLKTDFLRPVRNAEKAENQTKNRHSNVYPYDDNRVTLRALPNHPWSDYYNASFINGHASLKRCIAAQAPFKATLNDFWRMVWESEVKRIVMFTSEDEERQGLCTKYWPAVGSRKFGYCVVTLTREYIFPDYAIRELSVAKNQENRTITQYHFTAWSEWGVPEKTSTILNLRDLVFRDATSNEEPIVVHCRTGIGRTGTFIALDYLMDQAKSMKYIDVFECAENLGRQRVNMIQTKEQYIYLHVILRDALVGTSDEIENNSESRYQALLQRENISPIYSTLQETTPI